MKKNIILLSSLLFSVIAFSQVGINTGSPNATMDVSAKRDSGGTITDNTQTLGLQAPRITRAELTANTGTYGSNQRGALIYITDVSGGNTTSPRTNINAVGYYYFDGSLWQKITNGTYTGSTSVVLSGGAFQRAALTGDVTASQNSNIIRIANNVINTNHIVDLAVTPAKIAGGFNGNILTTNASGGAQWVASPAATLGPVYADSNSFTDVASFDGTNYMSMGYITLPPGKWIVSWVLQLELTGTPVAGTPASATTVFPRNFHVLSQLSSSNNALATSGFGVVSGAFGTLTGNILNTEQTYLGQIRGTSIVVVNTTTKLYVVSNGVFRGTLMSSNVRFKANFGENSIYAIPAN